MRTLVVRPPSGIRTWADWPLDVVDVLREWNKKRDLSFVYISTGGSRVIFRCEVCELWHDPSTTVGILRKKAVCDGCLIKLARAHLRLGT
jgi:hypothetical protein